MVGSFIKLMTFGYSNYYMDSMTWGKTREIMAAAEDTLMESEATAIDIVSELAIDLDIFTPTPTPTQSEIMVCDRVVACPPKEIMEEFISKYCISNMYELLPDASNNVFELNI